MQIYEKQGTMNMTGLPYLSEKKQLRYFFFLRFCKNITNFLSWVLWTILGLATSIKNDNANL